MSYKHKEHILKVIEDAFQGVKLENGVSLHETIVIDNYGSDKERKAARKQDEKEKWQNLIQDPELVEVSGIGGLSFYDAIGLRFHLPAYMSYVVHDRDVDIADYLIFQLTHLEEYNLQRFAVLNKTQKKAVAEFLYYIRHHTYDDFEFSYEKIDLALETYWNEPDSE
jgi:hypothetical protein